MLVFSVPRVYEKIYARVQAAAAGGASQTGCSSGVWQLDGRWCLATAPTAHAAGLRLRQRLAHQLV